jgi:hypothetical protein
MKTGRFFLKADVLFALDGKDHALQSVDFALNGIHGLSVPGLDPLMHVGKRVPMRIEVKSAIPVAFPVEATLAAVIGTDWSSMEIRFRTPEELRERLAQAIDAEGFEPVRHLRRFPRLPAGNEVPSMPAHAIVHSVQGPIVFTVVDLSPAGILLATESPRAAIIVPGTSVSVQLEARGRVLSTSEVRGSARRLEVYRHGDTGNIVYSIGLHLDGPPGAERSGLMPVFRAMAEDLSADELRGAGTRAR